MKHLHIYLIIFIVNISLNVFESQNHLRSILNLALHYFCLLSYVINVLLDLRGVLQVKLIFFIKFLYRRWGALRFDLLKGFINIVCKANDLFNILNNLKYIIVIYGLSIQKVFKISLHFPILHLMKFSAITTLQPGWHPFPLFIIYLIHLSLIAFQPF